MNQHELPVQQLVMHVSHKHLPGSDLTQVQAEHV